MSGDECADADEETTRALLARHGYDPDLPARGVTGPPGEFRGLRNHVCELDGVAIDGHSDPDRSGLCIYCSKDMP